MPKAINIREVSQMYRADAVRTVRFFEQALDSGQMKPDDVSIRDLFEAVCGREALAMMLPRRSGGRSLREAVNAVDTSAFTAITGQLVFSKVREEYQLAAQIADGLCRTMQTSFLEGEKIPGIGGIGDEAEIIEEGQPYPLVGMGQEYVEAPPTKKRGFIVPVTREIIVADRTGILMRRSGDGGKWMGVNKEKRVLDVALGIVNNYKRNGTALNTYLTAGAYINDQTGNTLVDWTDIENAELLYDAMTDPNTGEPMGQYPGAYSLIVPTALRRTALRIVQATDIRFGDGAANTTATYGTNPLNDAQIQVVSSPYVKARTSSATKWFYGQPKEAVTYSEVWGIETSQAPALSEAEFSQDITMRFKVSERGVAWMEEPRRLTRNAP
jgi:ribosomal protein S11